MQPSVHAWNSRGVPVSTVSGARAREVRPHQRQRRVRYRFMNGIAAKRCENMMTMAAAKQGRMPQGKRRKRKSTSGMNRNSNAPVAWMTAGLVSGNVGRLDGGDGGDVENIIG